MNKNILKLFIHILGFFSILFSFLYQCVLIHIPAYNDFAYDIGIVINIFMQGIFVSYILYLLLEQIQEIDRKNKFTKTFPLVIKNIDHYMQTPYTKLASKAGIEADQSFKKEFNKDNVLSQIKATDIAFMDYSNRGCGYRHVYEGLCDYNNEVIKRVENALKLGSILDDTTYDILFRIENCNYTKLIQKHFSSHEHDLLRINETVLYFIGPNSIEEYLNLCTELQKRFYELKIAKYIYGVPVLK